MTITKIKNSPGIRYRELARETKIPNSTMGYYIKKLEENQIIIISKTDNFCRFFTPEYSEIQCRVIAMLRIKNARKIMLALEKEEMSFSLLVEKLKAHPSTISIYLKKLVSFEIVKKNHKDRFAIKTENITKIINKYKSLTMYFGLFVGHNILQNQNNFALIDLGWYV